uniref:S-norcoclaurine synthase 1 n=1 Tax=Argemone mexicana TaxID=54796 RepID=D2SMN1_ARGME|nr:S-norcoclaurine synthase 1 [Argemone mexicana]
MSKLITTIPLKSMSEVIANYVLKNQSVIRKEVTYELEVPTSADSIWAVYSSPNIPTLLRDVLLPGVFEKLDVIEGNGGVGTVLDIVFPPGAVPRCYKEKFINIDNKKRLKEVIMIEGGHLDMGCTYYLDRIHVIAKTPNSCVIKSSIIYDVKKEYAEAMSKLITTIPLKSMSEVIANYVLKNQSVIRKEVTYELQVPTSADSIWAVYSSPNIPTILRDVLLPGVFERLDVIKGNGGVGTVLDIVSHPGNSMYYYFFTIYPTFNFITILVTMVNST